MESHTLLSHTLVIDQINWDAGNGDQQFMYQDELISINERFQFIWPFPNYWNCSTKALHFNCTHFLGDAFYCGWFQPQCYAKYVVPFFRCLCFILTHRKCHSINCCWHIVIHSLYNYMSGVGGGNVLIPNHFTHRIFLIGQNRGVFIITLKWDALSFVWKKMTLHWIYCYYGWLYSSETLFVFHIENAGHCYKWTKCSQNHN